MQIRLLAMMAVVAVAGCQQQTPDEVRPPTGARVETTESWDIVYLANAKVGHVHTVWVRDEENGEERISSKQRIQLKRDDDTSSVEQDVSTVESLKGEVRTFRLETRAGAAPMQVSGQVSEGKLIVTTSSGELDRKSLMPWTDATGGLFATQRSLKDAPPTTPWAS